MLDVEDDQRGGDDLPDPPRIEADVTQRIASAMDKAVKALRRKPSKRKPKAAEGDQPAA